MHIRSLAYVWVCQSVSLYFNYITWKFIIYYFYLAARTTLVTHLLLLVNMNAILLRCHIIIFHLFLHIFILKDDENIYNVQAVKAQTLHIFLQQFLYFGVCALYGWSVAHYDCLSYTSSNFQNNKHHITARDFMRHIHFHHMFILLKITIHVSWLILFSVCLCAYEVWLYIVPVPHILFLLHMLLLLLLRLVLLLVLIWCVIYV